MSDCLISPLPNKHIVFPEMLNLGSQALISFSETCRVPSGRYRGSFDMKAVIEGKGQGVTTAENLTGQMLWTNIPSFIGYRFSCGKSSFHFIRALN